MATTLTLTVSLWSSGAPTILYPTYASVWHLCPAITTSIFATYPIALVGTLVLFGNISDFVGRRTAIRLGLVLGLVALTIFAFAGGACWLFSARLLQGCGVGLVLGAASAALVESNPFSSKAPSTFNTASQAGGLGLATLVGALMLSYSPDAIHSSYVIVGILFIAAMVATGSMPAVSSPAVEAMKHWRPKGISIRRGTRGIVALAAVTVSGGYAIGAVFLSLGPAVAAVAGERSVIVTGIILTTAFMLVAVSAIASNRAPVRRTITLGVIATMAASVTLVSAALSHSLLIFALSASLGGVSYGLLSAGGLSLVISGSTPHHRAQNLSVVFLFAYVAQGAIAVTGGIVATASSLAFALITVSSIICLLAFFVIVGVCIRFDRPRIAVDDSYEASR